MKSMLPTVAAIFGGLCLIPAAHAQNSWYLHASSGLSEDWNTLADWWSSPTTGGTHPSSISSTDNFFANGFTLRTPGNAAAAPFGGGSLTLNGGGLLVKDTSSTTATSITNLTSTAGGLTNATGGTQIVNVTNFNNTGPSILNSGGSTRNLNLTIGTLTGNGNLDVIGGGIVYLSVTGSAANYLGTIYTDNAALTLQTNLVYGGPLVVGQGTKIVLNGNVTCTALTVSGGSPYAAGTYSVATLNAAYPSIFTGGSGSITVRPASNYYLHAGQGGVDDWNTLADWYSAPTGGSNLTAINPADHFFTGSFLLRTPSSHSSATFGGATLTMSAGGSVLLKAIGASTTIGNFVSTGGTIGNGTGGALVTNITSFDATSGTTILDADASNRGFALSVGRLGGAGNVTFNGRGGGSLNLNVTDAANYTGTLTLNASSTGTTTFANAIYSGGGLVIGAGNTVVLNQPVVFSALTVGSTVKPAGTYSASTLGFSGTGSITVQPHAAKLFGVNFAGATGDSGALWAKQSDYVYFGSKNQKIARVGVKWEYIQKTVNGALDPTNLAALDQQVSWAKQNGMQVFIDIHSYGKYNGNLIGSSTVPVSAFQDLWTKLATHYASYVDNSAIYGYDLMNEPSDSVGTWAAAAQAAINSIRAVDTTRYILVEGLSYSNAGGWANLNPAFPLADPGVNRIIYEAHSYVANSGNDQFGTYDAEGAYPDKAALKMAPFVIWLKNNHAQGLLGEYGVPKNDIRWNAVLNGLLQYMDDNGVSGTYWAGPGFNPASYPLGVEPTGGVDAPQMAVLVQY